MDTKGLGLKQQILRAALECSGGDRDRTFTMEDLLVCAWKNDTGAWGLRGYEDLYPDSDKIQKEIGARGSGQKSMVENGLLERVNRRVYRLTPAGLAAAAALNPSEPLAQEKADRTLESAVKEILAHPVFREWLNDPSRPKYFREAGHFWGVAPGTPQKTVRERVSFVERTLRAALEVMDRRGIDEIVEQRGKVLFDRKDIERALEFQEMLKNRFGKSLRLLAPKIEL